MPASSDEFQPDGVGELRQVLLGLSARNAKHRLGLVEVLDRFRVDAVADGDSSRCEPLQAGALAARYLVGAFGAKRSRKHDAVVLADDTHEKRVSAFDSHLALAACRHGHLPWRNKLGLMLARNDQDGKGDFGCLANLVRPAFIHRRI